MVKQKTTVLRLENFSLQIIGRGNELESIFDFYPESLRIQYKKAEDDWKSKMYNASHLELNAKVPKLPNSTGRILLKLGNYKENKKETNKLQEEFFWLDKDFKSIDALECAFIKLTDSIKWGYVLNKEYKFKEKFIGY